MQDRSYAIAIVVVLAICCIGVYVAVSGYFNSNVPTALTGSVTPGIAATPVVVVINTETPGAPVATGPVVPIPTGLPPASPLGAFQTIVAATTSNPGGAPTVTVKASLAATVAPLPPLPPPPPPPATTGSQSCTTPFCSRAGPPDATLGPGGNDCPRNYIFGRVVDKTGKGLSDKIILFLGPSGENGSINTKGPPDPPGSYNIPTGQPGNTYVLWLADGSPRVSVATQAYSGSGNCPNRLDFYQQ